MEEFKEKQKRQRVIVVEKYLFGEYDWKIEKIFTNAKKAYLEHFRGYFSKHYRLKSKNYQSFINDIKTNEAVYVDLDFYGIGEKGVQFRYTIHQLE